MINIVEIIMEYEVNNTTGYEPIGVPVVKAEPVFSPYESTFALIMLVLGFLFVNFILFTPGTLGISSTLFTLIFVTVMLVFFKHAGIKQTGKTLTILGIVLLSGSYFILFDNPFLSFLNLLFLMLTSLYWVFVSCGLSLGSMSLILGDTLNMLIVLPFSRLNYLYAAIKSVLKKTKQGKQAALIGAGLLIALPVTAVILSLLMSADAAFEALMTMFSGALGNFWLYVIQFAVGIPVAMYLFAILCGVRKDKPNLIKSEAVKNISSKARFMPRLIVSTAMIPLIISYTLFFISQLGYMLSAFVSLLPSGYSYAEYARRGFFELTAIAVINLAVILCVRLFCKGETNKGIVRFLVTLLCLFTMLLIISAGSKMFMYITVYGLSPLRVYTSWFMLLLFAVFFIIAVGQFRGKTDTPKWVMRTVTTLILVLLFSNTDAIIANVNTNNYLSGRTDRVDISLLIELGSAGQSSIKRLIDKAPDESVRNHAAYYIISPNTENDWRSFKLTSLIG